MADNVRTLKLSLYAPVPRGHRVAIHMMEAQVLIFNTSPTVVHDLTDDVWYSSSMDMINSLRGREPMASTTRVTEVIVGRVTQAACHISGGDRTTRRTQLDVVVEQVCGPGEVPEILRRRPLGARHADIFASDELIEQVWPNGARYLVRWDEAFTAVVHRHPGGEGGPVADIHLRLTQRRGGATQSVAVTCVITRTSDVDALPTLERLLPRIEGDEAKWLVDTVRYYANLHGGDFPL